MATNFCGLLNFTACITLTQLCYRSDFCTCMTFCELSPGPLRRSAQDLQRTFYDLIAIPLDFLKLDLTQRDWLSTTNDGRKLHHSMLHQRISNMSQVTHYMYKNHKDAIDTMPAISSHQTRSSCSQLHHDLYHSPSARLGEAVWRWSSYVITAN